jgi:hypothetical protein
MKSNTPKCEICKKKPATYIISDARTQFGAWQLSCDKCELQGNVAEYYVKISDIQNKERRDDWERHLSEKRWCDTAAFRMVCNRAVGE